MKITEYRPGESVTIRAVDGSHLFYPNDQGVIEEAPAGEYNVLVDAVYVYEDGTVLGSGHLVNKTDIRKLRRIGRTGREPKIDNWRPDKVMFGRE